MTRLLTETQDLQDSVNSLLDARVLKQRAALEPPTFPINP